MTWTTRAVNVVVSVFSRLVEPSPSSSELPEVFVSADQGGVRPKNVPRE